MASSTASGVRLEATFAAQRTWTVMVGSTVLAGIVAALPLLPAVAEAVGVSFRHTFWAMAVFVAINFTTTAVYRATGVSRLYHVAEYLEALCAMSVGPALLLVAANGQSVFWLFYMVSASQSASVGTRAHIAAIIVVPVATGVSLFGFYGDVPGLVASLLMTAVAAFLVITYRPLFARIDGALDTERELRARIVTERTRSERSRLARDLHDGLGADLTALVWKARALEEQMEDKGHAAPNPGIEHDLRDALARLRRTVLTLRGGG